MSAEDKKSGNKPDFWMKVASVIVDKRNVIMLLFVIAAIYSVIFMNSVRINQDITSYLPASSETRIGLTTMNEQFITYGSARVMVANITYKDAEKLVDDLAAVKGVKEVAFDNSEEHYIGSNALFSITVKGTDDDAISLEALTNVEELLSEYDVYVSSSVGATEKSMASLNKDMQLILVLAVLIIVLVLFISTRAFLEIPVLLITFGAAALLNKGTNYWLGEISSVTDSIAVVLQLALAIDYAIILCDRYMEEHEKLPPIEACKVALSKAIPEISSSSLTTVSGMAAMMFMQFKLGFDMGIVLVKAIIFSLISVFFLMPGVILIFSKGIDRTMHRSFVPKISFVGKFAHATRHFVPFIFMAVIIGAFYMSSNCDYLYDVDSVPSASKSEAKIAKEKINDIFGTTNQLVVMVPVGDYEKEAVLLKNLENLPCVISAMGLANQAVNDDYMVTTKLKPRQFSELADIDIEIARVLYMAYAYSIEQYGPVVTGIDDYSVPIIDMFLFLYDQYQQGYVNLGADLDETLNELYDKLHDGELQLKGDKYSRLVLNFNMPVEGEDTYREMETIRETAEQLYGVGNVLLVGNSTSARDLASSFAKDNIIISVLTALFVLLILLFTFKSAGLPVLLVLTIQGSIWINFTVPAIESVGVYFIAYLIVSAIQMGATIDYAIVISSRYLALKQEMSIKEAITETLNQAFPTIFTSGTILTCAGFLIGRICSDATVAAIGVALGRGTLISIILVLFVLPQILLLGDFIIEKTALSVKLSANHVNLLGRVRVNGFVRGEFTGRIEGEVRGFLEGKMDGTIDTRLNSQYMDAEEMSASDVLQKISKEAEAEQEQKLEMSRKMQGTQENSEAKDVKKTTVKKKKHFKFFSIIVLMACMLAIGGNKAYADEVNEEAEEDISADIVYINSEEEFLTFAYECRFDAYSLGTVFILNKDLDLTGSDFEGVPYFNGTFEGNNHNIFLELEYAGSNCGLFRFVGPFGYVHNLSVKGNVKATGSATNVGGIVGVNQGLIMGCTFRGSVSGKDRVGGIAGSSSKDAKIVSSVNSSLVLAEDYTGGIVGYNEGTVLSCINRGDINVEDLEPTLDVGGVDIGTLNITENIANRDNMGGIAGYSEGLISKCSNKGTVGYLHAGYNVGGIVGMQNGIVSKCDNIGNVLGRKDVGGIVGQAVPFVEKEYVQDALIKTQDQVDELNKTLRGINSTVSSTANKTAKYQTKINKATKKQIDKLVKDTRAMTETTSKEFPSTQDYVNNINSALDNIEAIMKSGTLNDAKIQKIQIYLADISKNITEINKIVGDKQSQSEELIKKVTDDIAASSQYGDTQNMVKTVNKGVNSVSKSVDDALDQLEAMQSEMGEYFALLTGSEAYVSDISALENINTLSGVVADCQNNGYIRGDINVGGIIGCMNVENENDPEFDFSFTNQVPLVIRSTISGVTSGCINNGRVEVKKESAGGIVGLQSLGLIDGCEGYGNVFGAEAKYLGGVVGKAEATVSSCYSLCTVSGIAYLGGIAGEAHGIMNCISVPIIKGTGENLGGITGNLAQVGGAESNYFYNDEVNGIDGINYISGANYMTYPEIMSLPNHPERFNKVILSFEIEGEQVSSFVKNYGGKVTEQDYPVVEEREGYYTKWYSDSAITGLVGNTIMDVEYIPWTTSVSGNVRMGNRSLFLVVGEFYEDTAIDMNEYENAMVLSDNEELLYAYEWDMFSERDKAYETLEGHFLMQDGYDAVELWLLKGNRWEKCPDTTIDGSYMVGSLEIGQPFMVVGIHKEKTPIWEENLIIAGAAIVLSFLISMCILIKRRKKKKAVNK